MSESNENFDEFDQEQRETLRISMTSTTDTSDIIPNENFEHHSVFSCETSLDFSNSYELLNYTHPRQSLFL